MPDENIERQMEFLLQQEARCAAKMEQLEEAVALFVKGTQDRFEAVEKRVDDVDDRLAARVDDVDEKIAALLDSQIRTEESIKKTDEALRNLIAVVDRYFSEGRNGSSKA